MNQPVSRGQRIAFFGGSFDPPHLGHLAVARAAQTALRLDTVLFAPVGAQPLKPEGSTASFEDRVVMTRLAIAGVPGFEVSLADSPRANGTPNYTVNTLEKLRGDFSESTLYCLMGADSFVQLRQWHRAAEVPFTAQLIVASRPGLPLDDLRAMLPVGLGLEPASNFEQSEGNTEGRQIALRSYSITNRTGRRAPLYVLPGLDSEISASQIREWIRTGAGLIGERNKAQNEALLPEAVAEYIRSRGLYR